MRTNDVQLSLEGVVDAVGEIDKECSTLLNGIEHGLVNVKLQFKERAYGETGKKLSEELLIARLLRQKLTVAGKRVEPGEVLYPRAASTKRCDLVLHLDEGRRMWLEIKLAWKAWFNCEGPPKYENPAYATYLSGLGRSHSLRHDFEKMLDANLEAGDHRAVCLIGFDFADNPMDEEVAKVVRQARESAPWEIAAERHWPDRRDDRFRINVWIWLLPGAEKRAGA